MTTPLTFLPPEAQARLTDYRERFIQRGKAVVLLGAGVSRRAGLPDGPSLARTLCQAAGMADCPENDLIAVCDRIVEHHGRPFLHRQLVAALDDERIPLSDAHQLLARIPFHRYVTTNVDRLMEWALRDAGKRPGAMFLSTDTELLRLERVPVIKPHGDLEHPHTMVFSTADFAEFAQRRPAFQRLLHTALEDCCLFIVGYRGDDPNFIAILDWIGAHGPGAEHLLVDFGRESERKALLDRHCYLIDPGAGRYELLADILGYLAGFDAKTLALYRNRRHLYRANPFPGLTPYRYAADHFRGRDGLARDLLARLPELPPVTVFFGDSGCGKSSLFQAGLAPLLEQSPKHRWAIQVLDDRLAAAMQVERAVAALTDDLAPDGLAVLVLDQFERLFAPPFSHADRDRFLDRDLPALVRQWRGRVRLCLVLRSDALHHLQPYRDRPGLDGIYHRAERIATLDRAEAEAALGFTFRRRDYQLSAACLGALVGEACEAVPDKLAPVYLPYLQLLANRFYEWLEDRYTKKRGYTDVLPVKRPDFHRFYAVGNPIEALVAETLVELLLLEPETAAVHRLLDLLIEGGRRCLLRRADLARHFIDPERLERLLATLADRRLLHFDEVLGGYELVHDSLVEPIRRALEQRRVDYSSSELLAIARGLFQGEPPSEPLLRNLARFSLGRGIGTAWLEDTCRPAAGWPALYLDLLRATPARAVAPLWQVLARRAEAEGRWPDGQKEEEALAAFLAADTEAQCEASLRLMAWCPLSREGLGRLLSRLDPDHGLADKDSGSDLIQHRDWNRAFAAALDLLLADARIKPDSLFLDYHSEMASRAGWWCQYYGALLECAGLTEKRRRARLDHGMNEAEEDVEQLLGFARALIAHPGAAIRHADLIDRCRIALRRRRGRSGFDLILALCRTFVEYMPMKVFLELGLHLGDLARGEQRHQAAQVLGLSAQREEDWMDLQERYFVAGEIEVKGALLQALMDSPAELIEPGRYGSRNITLDDGWHNDLAGYAAELHRADALAAPLARLADTDAAVARGLFDPTQTTERFVLLAYALADKLMYRAETAPQTAIPALIRLRRLVCHELARRARAHLPEGELEIPPDPLAVRDDEFQVWWDDALFVLPSLSRPLLTAADDLNKQLRWLHHHLRQDLGKLLGGLRLLASKIEEWQARYHALAQVCQTPGYTVYTPRVSRSPVFVAIEMLLEREDLIEQWATLPSPATNSDLKKARAAMAAFARAEEAAALVKALAVPETIIHWLLKVLSKKQVDGVDHFLWGLLGSSHRAGVPGHSEEEREALLTASLLTEYAGGESELAASLSSQHLLDVQSLLKMLLLIERQAPGTATEPLWRRLADWADEEPSSLILAEALAALNFVPDAPDWPDRLESLVDQTTDPAVRRAALDCLLRLTPSVEHRLLSLRWALTEARG